jgi:hypothetical protein
MSDNSELRAAVEKACQGEALTKSDEIIKDLLLLEFVVVACRKGFDDEGKEITQIVLIPDGGADHQIAGLLRNATIRMDAEMLDVYGE